MVEHECERIEELLASEDAEVEPAGHPRIPNRVYQTLPEIIAARREGRLREALGLDEPDPEDHDRAAEDAGYSDWHRGCEVEDDLERARRERKGGAR